MNRLRDQRTLASKLATLAIFLVGAGATATAVFIALGKPVTPLWSAFASLVALCAVCVVAGRAVEGHDAGWVYLVDLLVAAFIGLLVLTMEQSDPNSALSYSALRLVFIFVAVLAMSGYFDKRHPREREGAQDQQFTDSHD